MSSRFSEGRLCAALFVLCLLLNLGFATVGFRNSLLEVHQFRQLQTALTTHYMVQEPWTLAYRTPLFGPPWSAPMEFPVYQWCTAAVVRLTGWPLEPTGRAVAQGFLYLALPALAGLMGVLGVSPARRWLLPAAVLVSPAYLFYSRTFMIESCALAGTVWFLYAYARALREGGWRWLLAATALGALAALIKVTTFIVGLVPAAAGTLWLLVAAYRPARSLSALRPLVLRGLGTTLPAALAALVWVRFSDAIKFANPLQSFLASGPMTGFNFGSLAQRLSGAFWERLWLHTAMSTLPAINLGLAVFVPLILARTYRARAGLLALGVLAGPLIFANLYFVHDYYFYATAIYLLGLLVLGWCQILDLTAFSLGARWTVVCASLLLQLTPYLPGYFQAQRLNSDRPPELATLLGRITGRDDVLLVFGQDWDSRYAYYSGRRAVMVTDNHRSPPEQLDSVLARLPEGGLAALVVTGQLRYDPAYLKPFLQRYRLTPAPLLMDRETHVYLAKSRVDSALAALAPLDLKDVHLAAPPDAGAGGIPRKRSILPGLKQPHTVVMMSPKPIEIRHPFDIEPQEVGGQLVGNAHAPTDILFVLPPSASTASLAFGILAAAYTGDNRTGGVEFRLEHVAPDGTHRTLYSTYLDPHRRAADRGTKSVDVPLPAGLTGQLWARTLPGADGNIACAWAYWAHITLQ